MSGICKIWRGTREQYESINPKDFFTRYSVKEENGVYTEYYGTHRINQETGQLAPVIDIIDNISAVTTSFTGLKYDKVNLGNTLAISVTGLPGNDLDLTLTKYENGQPTNEFLFNGNPLKIKYFQDSLLSGYYVQWYASIDDGYTPHMEENPKMVADINNIITFLNTYYKDIDSLNIGDRYLISTNNQIIEKTYYGLTYTPIEDYAVKVLNKGLATYQLLDGTLMTYDSKIINCGEY